METAVKVEIKLTGSESGPARQALRAAQERLARALEHATGAVGAADLIAALGARSDPEFLVRVLTTPGALGPGADPNAADPIAVARLRGALIRDQVLAGPDMLTAAQLAATLGVQRQTVDNWRKAGKLLALGRGRRGYIYPAWQVRDHRPLAGLRAVLAALGPDDPWRAHRFLTSPEPRLADRVPIDMLRAGEVDAVVQAAARFGEQGAL